MNTPGSAPCPENPGISRDRPLVALTMGDAAGIGPELIIRAWANPAFHQQCRPLVIGCPVRLDREARRQGVQLDVVGQENLEAIPTSPTVLPCLLGSQEAVADLPAGQVHAAAGRAAVDYLNLAIDLALEGRIAAITTLPIHKEGLRAAGCPLPGHTEILAARTKAPRHAMVLYRRGLAVAHVTLHCPLREVFAQLSVAAIHEKEVLLDRLLRRLGVAKPRLAVAALNPHASDAGRFGDEEAERIAPAVAAGRRDGLDIAGPLPADTLFAAALAGKYDGVVAMYHDQGHIALKVKGWREAVNITAGLPIVRTSVAHGTAYDIVGADRADPTSLFEAVAVAAQLVRSKIADGITGE